MAPVDAAEIALRASSESLRRFDLAATLLWATSGAMLGARRGFDLVGIYTVALVSATGGGLLRDVLFLRQGPPAVLRSPIYLQLVLGAVVVVVVFGRWLRTMRGFDTLVAVVDAFGLGAYAVVGMNLALRAGLAPIAMIGVGMVNAVGGGVLRDLLTGDPPQVVRPGLWLASAVLCGCVLGVVLLKFQVANWVAGLATVGLVFIIRIAAIRFGIKSGPLRAFREDWWQDSNAS